jgi:hypothetical protein
MSPCRQRIFWKSHPYLASLVLGDLVLGVLLAVSALAVSAASLGNVDLQSATLISICSRVVSYRVVRRVWFLHLSFWLGRGWCHLERDGDCLGWCNRQVGRLGC